MDTMSDAHVRELLAPLELDMQELEPMDAPGFWSNFKDGVLVSLAVSAIYGGVASAVVT